MRRDYLLSSNLFVISYFHYRCFEDAMKVRYALGQQPHVLGKNYPSQIPAVVEMRLKYYIRSINTSTRYPLARVPFEYTLIRSGKSTNAHVRGAPPFMWKNSILSRHPLPFRRTIPTSHSSASQRKRVQPVAASVYVHVPTALSTLLIHVRLNTITCIFRGQLT